MEIPDKIFQILIFRGHNDIANLLQRSRYDLNESSIYGSRLYSRLTTLEIYSPIDKHEELLKLSDHEQEQIITAFHVIYPVKDNDIEINHVEFLVDPEAPVPGSGDNIYVPKEIDETYWHQGFFRLFISHSAAIKEKVKKLQDYLLAYGISAFVAHEDIEPTKEWLNTIESALFSCDALLAVIDENFRASNWCDQEAGIAFGMGKFIVPVRLGVDPYGFIGKFQGIQGKGKLPKEMAVEISSLLLSAEKTKKKLAEGIIEMFVSSKSYQAARDGVTKLKRITYINETLIKKLERGLTENSQIRDAIGVPEKVKQIIQSLFDL
jgi:hypothetical protein